jgi:hypothetical protein
VELQVPTPLLDSFRRAMIVAMPIMTAGAPSIFAGNTCLLNEGQDAVDFPSRIAPNNHCGLAPVDVQTRLPDELIEPHAVVAAAREMNDGGSPAEAAAIFASA